MLFELDTGCAEPALGVQAQYDEIFLYARQVESLIKTPHTSGGATLQKSRLADKPT